MKDLAVQIYRLLTKPTLAHRIYHSGGHTQRAADLAALVREVISEAQITFSTDQPNSPFIYRMDDSRTQEELDLPLRSMAVGIRDQIAKVWQ